MTKLKTITIRGMHNYDDVTYDLKDFTYIFGANGVGKSTILQAIQFALLGYIPNYNKTLQSIFTHCNNDKKMSVILVLNDGTQDITITRNCTKSNGKVAVGAIVEPQVDLESIIADIESPVFNFNEFIGMTANKLKEWFISFLGNSNSETAWADVFTSEDKVDTALQAQLLAYVQGKSVDVDTLKQVNEYLKSLQSAEKANIERISGTIRNLVRYDDVSADTTIDPAALKTELAELDAKRNYALQYEERLNHNNIIKAKLSSDKYHDLKGSLEDDDNFYTLVDKRLDLSHELEECDNVLNDIKAESNTLIGEIKAMDAVVHSNGICPYTHESCDDIPTLKAKYTAKQKELSAKLEQLNSVGAQTVAKRDEVNKEYSRISAELSNLKLRYSERDALMGGLLTLSDAPEQNSTAYANKFNEITHQLVKLEANAKYYNMVDDLTKDKLISENRLDMIKEWIKSTGANGLQSSLTNGAFAMLASDMDTYIQSLYGDPTIHTKFILEEKANSFSFGLIRNEKYIAFDLLSSGEKCIFTLAMLLCLIANAKSELKLILVDDLLDHLDDDKIATLFRGLNKIKDIQIILAGVKKYTESNYDDVVITVAPSK